MKKSLFIPLFAAVLTISCQRITIADQQPLTKAGSEGKNAVFYEPLQSWIQPVTLPDTAAKSETPFYYLVEFRPETSDDFSTLVSDTTKYVTLVPFGYEVMPDYEISAITTAIQYPTQPFALPNDEEIEDCCIDCQLSSDVMEAKLVPVYAYWPVAEPLPASNPHTITGHFIASSDTKENVRIGDLIPFDRNVTITTYDSVLGEYVPVRNASVRVRDASSAYIEFLETDGNGKVSIPSNAPTSAAVILNLSSDEFYVAKDSLLVCDYVALGNVSDFPPTPFNRSTTLYLPYAFRTHIYQAAWYYFNGSNDLLDNLPKINTGSLFRINCMTYGSVPGFTNYAGHPIYIELIDYWTAPYDASKNFCTTLHEFGHASHYQSIGSSPTNTCEQSHRESLASLVGWYNTLQYYSHIITSTVDINSICTNGRQSWVNSSLSPYTPFFVDLFDNNNQHGANSSYVNDTISGVPADLLIELALSTTSLQEAYDELLQYVGIYFTKTQLDLIASYYSGLITIQ